MKLSVQSNEKAIRPIFDWLQNFIGYIFPFQNIAKVKKQSQLYKNFLEASEAISIELTTEAVLLNLAKQLVNLSGFHLCAISELDKNSSAVISVAEYARTTWLEGVGDSYILKDYPETEKVILSKQPIIINDPKESVEGGYMEEVGWARMMMLPLMAGQELLGHVEIGRTKNDDISPEILINCQKILANATGWLKTPFDSNNIDPIFDLAAEIRDEADADAINISEWIPEEGIVASRVELIDSSWPTGKGPTLRIRDRSSSGLALNKGVTSIVHRSDQNVSHGDRLDLEKWNAKTLVAFPLLLGGEIIGLIELYNMHEEIHPEAEELSLWKTLADKAGYAIQNSRLFQTTDNKLKETSVLLEVGSTIATSLKLDEILPELAKHMAIAVDVTSAYFVTYDYTTKGAVVVAEYYSPEASPEERESDLGIPYYDEEWLHAGAVEDDFEIKHYDDNEILDRERVHLVKFGGKTTVNIPLFTNDGLVGHCELWESRNKREFTDDEIKLCQAIAQQASISIEKAVLYEKAKKELREHEKTQVLLSKSEKYYRGLFENAHDAIILFDPEDEQVLDVNQRACELYGFSKEEFINLQLTSITEDITFGKEQIGKILSWKTFHNFETRQYKKDRRKMILEVNASLVEFNGKPSILSVNRDITSRKKIEEKLKHDALHDSLTNLPNRTLFMDRLRQAIARQKRYEDAFFAVLFFDLDNFKGINDTLGHSFGDKFLSELANRLIIMSRETDTVARFGGDEFAILMEAIQDINDIADICNRVLEVVNREILIEGKKLKSTASIGVVAHKTNGSNAEDIIRDSDIAMYKAKEMGGNRYEFFDEKMRKDLFDRLSVENDLEEALKNEEFILYYQPIISLDDGSIVGLESLIRWQKPGGELILPSQFIPFAEQTGLINPIGEWVIDDVINQILQWNSEVNYKGITVSINISGVQLEHLQFSDKLLMQLKESKLDTGSLSIEVTESAIIPNIHESVKALQLLNEHGMDIYLDDFGVGYSSLSYLSQLPIKVLKIDRHFLSDIEEKNNLNLLRIMISLGHELGMTVIAEGIETLGQLKMLRAMGCDLGQGYFIQRPADVKTITKILKKGRINLSKAKEL